MSARKPGLPICQHITLGADLQAVREALMAALTTLDAAYPKSAKAVRQAHAALKAVDELRCDLDNLSARENPADGAWSPTIYYGANREMRQRELRPLIARHRREQPACCTNTEETTR